MTAPVGESLFWLRPPSGPPTVPECWSWSSLASWRRCPRQWWLSRARFPNASTPYPQPLYVGALEGILLHEIVNAFVRHTAVQQRAGVRDYATIRTSFPVRRLAREYLAEHLKTGANPRADNARLAARISIDAIINAFRSVAISVVDETRTELSVLGTQRTRGSEVWFATEKPPLCGKIDYIDAEEIVDFKTGEAKDADAEQLRFYALLVWLTTGKVPPALTVAYVRTGRKLSIEVPVQSELAATAEALRVEVESIRRHLGTDETPPAHPNAAVCSTCAVRQLCAPYWRSSVTAELRLCQESAPSTLARRCDVQLEKLPAPSLGGAYVGEAFVPQMGRVEIRIGPSHVVPNGENKAVAAKLLNAMVESQDGVLRIIATPGTEVFWSAD